MNSPSPSDPRNRRAFLRDIALYGGGAVLAANALPSVARATEAASNRAWRNSAGLELFTIGRLMQPNQAAWESVLEQLATMGIREVEPASAFPTDMTPQATRAMLDRYGITMISSHTSASGSTLAEVEKSLEAQQIMGIKYTDYNLSGGTQIPGATAAQQVAADRLTTATAALEQEVTAARDALQAASFESPVDRAAITAAANRLASAEANLATTRADWLAGVQGSPNRLSDEQTASLRASASGGGRGGRGGFGGFGGGGRGGATAAALTLDQVLENGKRTGDELNARGQVLQKFGMKLYIHNHTGEFTIYEGTNLTQHDMQVRYTDPELVAMQLDVGWCYCAGVDALSLFRKYPGRYELWHVKDFAGVDLATRNAVQGTQPPGSQIVPVGQGVIDYKTVFAYAEQAGLKHWCIEQDGAIGMEDVQSSYDFLMANVLV